MPTWSSRVLWKTEIGSDQIECLAEKAFTPSVEGMAWFLLTAYGKMQEERVELRESLRGRLGKLSTCLYGKSEEASSGENISVVAGESLHYEVTHDVNQTST